jgi:primosomal replication protein N
LESHKIIGDKEMNDVTLSGILKDIQHSHEIDGVTFDRAKLLVKRDNGVEDIINLRFKSFSNVYKDNDEVCLKGNLRSYSYKVSEDKNKVIIYVFTYFDKPEDEENNKVVLDGRICKINPIRTTRTGKHNIHLILANNLILEGQSRRLNSYIPCIAWGKIAKELSELDVNTKISVTGSIHSREHKKTYEDGNVEIRVAHELLIEGFEVIE